jgi:hypothetical protein
MGPTTLAYVLAPSGQAIQHHEERRGGHVWRRPVSQPLEARDELLIVDRHFSIEDRGATAEPLECVHQLGEFLSVVAPVPADQRDMAMAIL